MVVLSIFLRSTISAAACNVAAKILSPKFDRLSYRFSRAFYFDAYYSKRIRNTF